MHSFIEVFSAVPLMEYFKYKFFSIIYYNNFKLDKNHPIQSSEKKVKISVCIGPWFFTDYDGRTLFIT